MLRWSPWLVLAAGAIGEAAVLTFQDRRLWFFRDDFGFLLGRQISPDPVKNLLTPHNQHWSTLPLIAFRAMWHVFGLRHYLPYALMPLLLHLAVAVCLVMLARRAGAGPWPAVLTGLIFLYVGGGAGAENTLWAFQIGFIGSCLGGVIALICFDLALEHHEDRSRRRWFWIGEVFLIAALMCSGMGVPMAIAAAAWTFYRRGGRAALRTAALPFVVFAGWYIGWGHTGFANTPLATGVTRGPLSAAKGLLHVWSGATGVSFAGPALLLVLMVAVVLTRYRPPLFAVGAAGLVGLLFLYLIVGFGRSNSGTIYVLHSRYLYVGLVLCAPAVACVLELVARRMRDLPWAAILAWLVVGVVVIVLGAAETAQYAAKRRAVDPAREQELLAAATLIRHGVPLLSDRIDPHDFYRSPAMSVSNLKKVHALAELPRIRPSSAALFDERSILQVDVRDTAMNVPLATAYHWSDHWTGTAADPPSGRRGYILRGCTARTTTGPARLVVRLGPHGAQVEINFKPQGDTDLAVRTRIVRRGQASYAQTWPLVAQWKWNLAGPKFFVATTMHDAMLEVRFMAAGRVKVCGAQKTPPGGAG